MAQDQTRAARMVAQGCTKVPTMGASTRSHQEPMAHRPTGAPIAPRPRGKFLTAKAGRRHAAFVSTLRKMRQSSTSSHSTTSHRQASPSATDPEEAPIPQVATGFILKGTRGRHDFRASPAKWEPTCQRQEARQARMVSSGTTTLLDLVDPRCPNALSSTVTIRLSRPRDPAGSRPTPY